MEQSNCLPRGLRNNNPLNIIKNERINWVGKYKNGTDRIFESFTNLKWGFRAAFVLLKKYINVNHCNTIHKIIHRWAPDGKAAETAYEQWVAKVAGLGVNETVKFDDQTTMLLICSGMCEFENGKGWNPQDHLWLWKAMYEGYFMVRESTTDFIMCPDPEEALRELLKKNELNVKDVQ